MPPFPQARDVRSALFGGRGGVSVQDLLGSVRAGPIQAVLACELEPAGVVGRHVQQALHVLLIVLEGEGAAEVNDVAQPLSSGTTVFVPFGSTLRLSNASATAALRYLMVKAG